MGVEYGPRQLVAIGIIGESRVAVIGAPQWIAIAFMHRGRVTCISGAFLTAFFTGVTRRVCFSSPLSLCACMCVTL